MASEFYTYHTELDCIYRISELNIAGNSVATELSIFDFRELRHEIISEDFGKLRTIIESNPFELIFNDLHSLRVVLELQK